MNHNFGYPLVLAGGAAIAIIAQPWLRSPAVIDLASINHPQLCEGGGFKITSWPAYQPILDLQCADKNAVAFTLPHGDVAARFEINGVVTRCGVQLLQVGEEN